VKRFTDARPKDGQEVRVRVRYAGQYARPIEATYGHGVWLTPVPGGAWRVAASPDDLWEPRELEEVEHE
jgi:hypothetical protein